MPSKVSPLTNHNLFQTHLLAKPISSLTFKICLPTPSPTDHRSVATHIQDPSRAATHSPIQDHSITPTQITSSQIPRNIPTEVITKLPPPTNSLDRNFPAHIVPNHPNHLATNLPTRTRIFLTKLR